MNFLRAKGTVFPVSFDARDETRALVHAKHLHTHHPRVHFSKITMLPSLCGCYGIECEDKIIPSTFMGLEELVEGV